MKSFLALSYLILILFANNCLAQISPPGEGIARTADWFAFGVRQKLDTIDGKGWQSISYIGLGRKSNPDNYNPLFKPAILVTNQEFYHQFHNNWQYSLALSYRRQDEYLNNKPYYHDSPKLKQEFRLYSRFSYIFSTSQIKLTPTLRQEFRKFCSPSFRNMDEDFQYRSRFRLQLTAALDRKKEHRVMISSEQLFSLSKENSPDKWTDFHYRESRFSVYYSYSPKTAPLTLSIGYMNNLVGKKKLYDVHYIAFDLVIENPFKIHHRKKEARKEYSK